MLLPHPQRQPQITERSKEDGNQRGVEGFWRAAQAVHDVHKNNRKQGGGDNANGDGQVLFFDRDDLVFQQMDEKTGDKKSVRRLLECSEQGRNGTMIKVHEPDDGAHQHGPGECCGNIDETSGLLV